MSQPAAEQLTEDEVRRLRDNVYTYGTHIVDIPDWKVSDLEEKGAKL